jgi:hypothetical protein
MPAAVRLAAILLVGAALVGTGSLAGEDEGVGNMYEVKREDDKVYITGMDDMDWGASAGGYFTLQDSFMGGLVHVLRCAGRDVTYAEVMGLSAQAFKLTLPESLHPGAAQGHVGYAVFDEDGAPVTPEGANGPTSFHGNAMRVFGIEWSHIDLNPEETPDWREQLLAAVRESVDNGIPIFYMDGEWGLIVGYREDGSAFLCRHIGAKLGYQEMERPRGCIGDVWWAAVASPTREPLPREQAVRESLHSAVIGASTVSIGDGDIANGLAAYELWIRVLKEWKDDGARQGNLFNYGQLLTSREAASMYLRGIAGAWTGRPDESSQAAGEHLHTAADGYRAIADRLSLAQDCADWRKEGWGAEDRATETEVLRDCLADERQAVAEIEAALAALRG